MPWNTRCITAKSHTMLQRHTTLAVLSSSSLSLSLKLNVKATSTKGILRSITMPPIESTMASSCALALNQVRARGT